MHYQDTRVPDTLSKANLLFSQGSYRFSLGNICSLSQLTLHPQVFICLPTDSSLISPKHKSNPSIYLHPWSSRFPVAYRIKPKQLKALHCRAKHQLELCKFKEVSYPLHASSEHRKNNKTTRE